MQLIRAQRDDFLQIARQTYDLWSAGLSRSDYRHLLWAVHYQVWARRNSYRLVYKISGEVVTSCKIVQLRCLMKGKEYKLWGLGSVYTAKNWRNNGLATQLIDSVTNKSKDEDVDAIILFSAINSRFYSSCGFIPLGGLDFQICPSIYSLDPGKLCERIGASQDRKITLDVRSSQALLSLDRSYKADTQNARFHFSSFVPWVSAEELNGIIDCYRKWLVNQPFGIQRSLEQYKFQLAKFLYFSGYAKSNRSTLFLTIVRQSGQIIGYSITEYGDTSIRILELIGTGLGRAYLWRSLISEAKRTNVLQIIGYESGVRDLIPVLHLDEEVLGMSPPIRASHIQCYHRSSSLPMCLPINPELEMLTELSPCPILEFDYF